MIYYDNIRHKQEIMGVAALWIFLGHCVGFADIFTNDLFRHPIINALFYYGWGGVEIFIFLSGIGISYSLRKNDLKQYLWNRFIRLFPAFFCISTICAFVWKSTITDYFLDLSTLNFWMSLFGYIPDAPLFWYIPASAFLYLLAIPCYPYINKLSQQQFQFMLFAIVLCCYSIALAFPSIRFLLYRIPLFLFGLCFSKIQWIDSKKIITFSCICYGALLLIKVFHIGKFASFYGISFLLMSLTCIGLVLWLDKHLFYNNRRLLKLISVILGGGELRVLSITHYDYVYIEI